MIINVEYADIWKEAVVDYLKVGLLPTHLPDETEKYTDSNEAPTEYKSRIVLLHQPVLYRLHTRLITYAVDTTW
jgi:hypothetical protein